jgi:hypothetical protein
MTLGVLAVLLAGLLLVREEGPGAASPRVEAPAPPPTAPPQAAMPLRTTVSRNVFEFGAPLAEPAAPVATVRVAPAPPTTSAPPPPPPPPAVRLVGVVNRGGTLKAALALGGEVVMLGVGEERDGYRVEAIDEETGVRVSGPAGVLVLAPE